MCNYSEIYAFFSGQSHSVKHAASKDMATGKVSALNVYFAWNTHIAHHQTSIIGQIEAPKCTTGRSSDEKTFITNIFVGEF